MPKKIIFVVIIVAVLVVALKGCGNKEEETQIMTTKSEEEIAAASAKFINMIEKEEYKGLIDYIYLPEEVFVTNEDIEWFLPRTNLEDLVGKRTDVGILGFEDASVPSDISESTTVAKTVTYQSLENADDTYEMLYVLNRDNKWKLYIPGFLVSEFSFIADKNVGLKVNGVEIDSSYITDTYTEEDAPSKNSVVYTLHNVPNKKIPIVITQGKNSKTVTVDAGSEDTYIIQ